MLRSEKYYKRVIKAGQECLPKEHYLRMTESFPDRGGNIAGNVGEEE